MEQEIQNETVTNASAEIGEAEWKAHVVDAEKFSGSNLKYCKSHGLSLSRFRKYKSKFGMVATRGRPRKGFVRVESLLEPGAKEEPVRSFRPREFRGLPDPRWMAEFVTALLDPQ